MCPCQILSGPCQILSKGAPNIYLLGGREHFSTGLFLGSSSVSMPNAAAILDFAIGKKYFRKLVPRVEEYLLAKFCPNRIKGIHLPSRNVIFEPKLCWNSLTPPHVSVAAALMFLFLNFGVLICFFLFWPKSTRYLAPTSPLQVFRTSSPLFDNTKFPVFL